MKWFRHFSDSYTNIKLRAVLHELGLPGYAVYWLCLELVAQQGSMNFSLNQNRTWELALCTTTKLQLDELRTMLERFAQLNLIDSKALSEGKLAIPKMKEYMDAYTQRRVFEVRKKNVKPSLSVSVSVYTTKHFDILWLKYLNKVGRKEALMHFMSSVKTETDWLNINQALDNYNKSEIVKKDGGKYIQNGKTWFNNWQDWIVPPKAEPDRFLKQEKK